MSDKSYGKAPTSQASEESQEAENPYPDSRLQQLGEKPTANKRIFSNGKK